MDKETRSV